MLARMSAWLPTVPAKLLRPSTVGADASVVLVRPVAVIPPAVPADATIEVRLVPLPDGARTAPAATGADKGGIRRVGCWHWRRCRPWRRSQH